MKYYLKQSIFALCVFAFTSSAAQGVSTLWIVHNCADPALDTVDIYFNGVILDSNLIFRSVYYFQTFSDSADTITIAYKHSTGVVDSIQSFAFDSFAKDQWYVLMISGVLGSGFEPNPDGLSTAFNLNVITPLDSIVTKTLAGMVYPDTSVTYFKFFQGSTDLPTIKIIERLTSESIIPTVSYDDIAGYDSLRHDLYEFQMLSSNDSQNFGTYVVDLTNLGGQAIVIFSSGFANPLFNESGPALGLYALISNNIVPLPLEAAAFQLFHNCADTAADSVDVYVNGALAYPDFAFRTATPALLEYAYATYDIGLAPKNSTSVSDTFWHQQYFFARDTFYTAMMSGLLNPASYKANPEGINTSFNVLMTIPAEDTGSSAFNCDFFMVNGATDAPALDLVPQGGPSLVSDLPYGGQSEYVSVPAEFMTLKLTDTSGSVYGGTYFANFPAFQSQSVVLLVSGFLNPSANNNGASIGLYMSPVAGGAFIPLFPYTSINEIQNTGNISLYPNPASDRLFIHLNAGYHAGEVNLEIMNLSGQSVKQVSNPALQNDGRYYVADISDLSEGLYLLRLTGRNGTSIGRFVVAR